MADMPSLPLLPDQHGFFVGPALEMTCPQRFVLSRHFNVNASASRMDELIDNLVDVHPALRVKFTEHRHRLRQVLDGGRSGRSHVRLPFAFNSPETLAFLTDYVNALASNFNIEIGHLAHFSVLQWPDGQVSVLMVLHHLICDQISLDTLERQVKRAVEFGSPSAGYDYAQCVDAVLQLPNEVDWRQRAVAWQAASENSLSDLALKGSVRRSHTLTVPLAVVKPDPWAVWRAAACAYRTRLGRSPRIQIVHHGRDSLSDVPRDQRPRGLSSAIGWFALTGLLLADDLQAAPPAPRVLSALTVARATGAWSASPRSDLDPALGADLWLNAVQSLPSHQLDSRRPKVPADPTFVGTPFALELIFEKEESSIRAHFDIGLFNPQTIESILHDMAQDEGVNFAR